MFGKILNATVSGLTAIPFAFAAYHVCKNLFADEKPAPEEKEGQAPDEQSQDGAAQQKSAENVESEAQAPVIITSGNKVSITETNAMEELNNVPEDDEQ